MAWPSIICGCLYVCICVCVFLWDSLCSRDRETSWKCVNLQYSAKTHTGTQRLTCMHTHTHTCINMYTCTYTHFHETNISLHTGTKWGNRSKLFAYKLMKYYWVKLSWMLITKVMHYLLINESSLFWARDGTSKCMISVGTQWRVVIACAQGKKKQKKKHCSAQASLQVEGVWGVTEERRGDKKVEERIHCWKGKHTC